MPKGKKSKKPQPEEIKDDGTIYADAEVLKATTDEDVSQILQLEK